MNCRIPDLIMNKIEYYKWKFNQIDLCKEFTNLIENNNFDTFGGLAIKNNKYNEKDSKSRYMIIMNCRPLNSTSEKPGYILNIRKNERVAYLPEYYCYSNGSFEMYYKNNRKPM